MTTVEQLNGTVLKRRSSYYDKKILRWNRLACYCACVVDVASLMDIDLTWGTV